jgi:hypothetical protein
LTVLPGLLSSRIQPAGDERPGSGTAHGGDERSGYNLGSTMMTFALDQFRDRIGLAVSAALLSACASVGPGPVATAVPGKAVVTAPSLGFFSSIKVPSDREPVLQLSARGVQIFRCEKRDTALNWVFRQPEAELFDASGKVVARHGASLSFEHVDGSRLLSTITGYDEAPKETDLRWLLLSTRSFGKGAFEGVTHAQRVNTQGGMPPTKCSASQLGQLLRVDFTSEFIFYRPRAEASG